VAAFDEYQKKTGKKVNGVKIYPLERAPEIIKKCRADIGIIAVPKEQCQEVADYMVLSGLHRILNFAPHSINVPEKVQVRSIDFTLKILSLFCGAQS